MVFVGALDYRANVEGLRWFCREVWPAFRQRVPDATFAIVGRQPGEAVWRLADQPGIVVVGEVPDVRPHVSGAAVVIAPLQVARGIQNKVLEAMAMGRPVLATPQALEGIGAIPNEDVLLAASPAEWVDQLAWLLGDGDLRARLARNGRRYVETHHGWQACLAALSDLLSL